MKIVIDTERRTLVDETSVEPRPADLYTLDAFRVLSTLWVKVGWALKYSYSFTWLGRPIIQLPEDMVRAQEVIARVRPDVILETGVAHGGSLVYYASLCKLLNHGRVIGVDIDIRPSARRALADHPLSSLITLIEGDSVAVETVRQVGGHIRPGERVMVFLDSAHHKSHVLAELELYGNLVTTGSYLVATDGIIQDLHDVPGGRPEWIHDNPAAAAAEFLNRHPEFEREQPVWPFNESELTEGVTYWPSAWLLRKA